MAVDLTHSYRAELLVRTTMYPPITNITINGGCDLSLKCKGIGDFVAEQIQMPLPNSGTISARWMPQTRDDGKTFISAFAGYHHPDHGDIRFDNAHDRNTLHIDSNYDEIVQNHEEELDLSTIQLVNRRRVALIQLLRVLEHRILWNIPIWFYMPWCMWWDDYSDFPNKLREKKPAGIYFTDFCEAIMAYVCFFNNFNQAIVRDNNLSKKTIETIKEAMDRVTFELSRANTFEFSTIVYGKTAILPFLMYAPPGAKIEGPPDIVNPLLS